MTVEAGGRAPRDTLAVTSRGTPYEVKLARRIASRLEREILAADLPVGTLYALEADLELRYGVGRAVLREAIGLVEHHGLVTVRRGGGGGLVLRAPGSRPLTNAVVVYLEHVGTTVEDLLTVRSLLEPLAARLAARNLTDDGVAALRDVVATGRAREGAMSDTHNPLHLLVGRIGGNRVLELFIGVLVELTLRYARVPPPLEEDATEVLAIATDHAHERIVDAIVAGNATLAEQRTVKHLRGIRDWLLSARQDPIRHGEGALRDPAPTGSDTERLAEVVARRLMFDIAASDVGIGEIYGSAPELQAHFNVSRAVFREAVRLLEYHSVARMQRGPSGGLVVTRPDPAASVEATAVYLDYERVGADELRDVREVIELGAIELLGHRMDDDLAESLREPHPDPRIFHLRLAELTGNPVLTLFLRILLAMWDRHTTDAAREDVERAATVAHDHDEILSSLLAGDTPFAQRRMRRHLTTLGTW